MSKLLCSFKQLQERWNYNVSGGSRLDIFSPVRSSERGWRVKGWETQGSMLVTQYKQRRLGFCCAPGGGAEKGMVMEMMKRDEQNKTTRILLFYSSPFEE